MVHQHEPVLCIFPNFLKFSAHLQLSLSKHESNANANLRELTACAGLQAT